MLTAAVLEEGRYSVNDKEHSFDRILKIAGQKEKMSLWHWEISRALPPSLQAPGRSTEGKGAVRHPVPKRRAGPTPTDNKKTEWHICAAAVHASQNNGFGQQSKIGAA